MNRPEPHGYVTDVRYPDTFFRELSPVWLNYVAALCGGLPHDVNRTFTYLELGCGFATSTVVNAGALPRGEFFACDFNPEHIAAGRNHAAALGVANVRLLDTPFEELLARDLPDFDFIVLHGVYSWVNSEARASIRRIVERKLKPGGLLYLSYNCQPGWTVETPLRKLLMELASSASGNTSERAALAAQALQELSGSKLRYFSANPQAAAAAEAYVRSPSNYLAHEFMSQTWELFYSTDILTEMDTIGLEYLGSATLADNHPMLIVDERAANAIAALPSQRQRHLAMDFAVNRRFRRDLFVRGHPRLGEADIARHLGATVIGAVTNPNALSARVKVPRGEVTFQDSFIHEIRELLARGSMTIGEIVPALGGQGRDSVEIMRNVIFLLAAGMVQPFAKVYQPTPTARARGASSVLERALATSAPTIPCEVLGNGVPLTAAERDEVSAWLAGAQTTQPGRVADLVRLGLVA